MLPWSLLLEALLLLRLSSFRSTTAQQQIIVPEKQTYFASTEGIATSIKYDEQTDRIYMTGDRQDDCWLGIVQLPPALSEAKWIKDVNLGMEGQTESCTAVETCRTGNSRKLFITGISFGGSSVLRTGDTVSNESSAEYQRTSGWLWDVTWYGEVKGGYYRPQHVPTSMATSCDYDVFVTWLYGEGAMRLTRIGRSPLHTSDVLTANSKETFRNENMTISTVKTLATKTNPNAESYDEYMYLQQPWSQRWSRNIKGNSNIHLFDQHLVLLSGSSLIAVDAETGMIRRRQDLGQRLSSACHASGSEYMYAVGHSGVDGGAQTTIWCIELESLTIDWSSDLPDQDATACAVTPDDQRVYVAGEFGVAQIETMGGEGIWLTKTLPVHAIVSDSFGNAVVLSNDVDLDIVRVQLVERLTGHLRNSSSASAVDSSGNRFFAFVERYQIYATVIMAGVLVLSVLLYFMIVRRQRKRAFGPSFKPIDKRPTMSETLDSIGLIPKSQLNSSEVNKDMDPLLRSRRIV